MSAARACISAVSFLNARPITYGLERGLVGEDRFELSFDLPSRCAAAATSGRGRPRAHPRRRLRRIDDRVAHRPRHRHRARGPVRTVLLVGEVPWEEMTSVALDGASRSSAAAAAAAAARARPGSALRARCRTTASSSASAASGAARHRRRGFAAAERFPHVYDLGAEWRERTGLPFVYAVWVGRPDALRPATSRSCREPCARAWRPAGDRARVGRARAADDAALGERYLTENIRYRLGAEELSGAAAFLERAHAAASSTRRPGLRLFPSDARASQVQQGPAPRPREVRAIRSMACSPTPPAGTRLSPEDGVRLYDAASLCDLGLAADARRRALHPRRRRHLHHRSQRQLHQRLRHALQVLQLLPPARRQDRGLRALARGAGQKFQETVELGGVQILLQGGAQPRAAVAWYEELFRWMKANFPARHPRAVARGDPLHRRARGAVHPRRDRAPDRRGARLDPGRRRRDPRRRDPARASRRSSARPTPGWR